MKVKLTKKMWLEAGRKGGWIKSAGFKVVDNDFNRANYPNLIGKILDEPPAYAQVVEVDGNDQKIEAPEPKYISFSYGMTPPEIINERVHQQCPDGYPMTIRSQDEWSVIAAAVNQGIDSHLEGFTRSKFDSKTGQCLIHPDEMKTFLRRLDEDGSDEATSLRVSILDTLGIEEI